MPLKTKIVLSDKELALVQNADWILTKQSAIQKIYQILQRNIDAIDQSVLPATVHIKNLLFEPPKISKGENYKSLPYIILDHPRLFHKEDIFAVRTMFWWSNFFSITFHVAGIHKKIFGERIIANYDKIPPGIFICIHKEQWHHHFEQDNYILVMEMKRNDIEALINVSPFIKLAVKFDLSDINNISEQLKAGYKTIGEIIT